MGCPPQKGGKMKKRLCLLALCLAALLGLSLFFVACDDEPAPGPTPTPVEHTHSYTSVTIAMADYMGKEGANAGKFIKDVAVPCSGEDCDSTLTLTKDELNAVFAAIMEDVDAAGYTAIVEGGNDIASFKVTKGEYTVTVNLTQPHTHTFNAVTISFDEYIDEENWVWEKPLEVPCYDSPRGCTGKLTFTVEELNNQSENFVLNGELANGTLTKDGHTVYVTVTGVPASEGPDEPAKSPFSITVKIGQAGLEDNTTYTYCVGTTVAYTVTVTDTRTNEPVTGADLQHLSATYQIGDGEAVDFTQQAANFTFATVGIYTIEVKYDNGEDYPATFTCTVEVSEHEGTYHAATPATCTEAGTIAYLYCDDCHKYFKVTGTADDYTIGEEFDYNDGEGIINQADPAKGHRYTAVEVAYSGVSTDSQWAAEVACGNGCDAKLTLTMDAFDTADGWTLDTENGYRAPSHNAEGQGNYYKSVTQDGYNVKVTVTGVAIPANGEHTYAYTATAAEYQAGSKQVNCTYDGCNQTVEITLPELTAEETWTDSDVQAASCTAPGSKTMTCTVSAEGDVQVTVTVTGVVIPQLSHTMTHTEATAATCTAAGNYEYWYCSTCQTYYKDESGSEAYDDQAATVIPIDENAHAWAQEWSTDENSHWYVCTNDDCTVKKEEAAHTWEYTASNGGGHYRACSVCRYKDTTLYNHKGTYAYGAEKNAVVFTCSVCKGTVDCAITGIDVTAETGAYIVDNGDGTYTAYGFTVEAVYEAVAGNEAAEIIIPAADWTATPQGSYKAAVEFACGTLKDTPDGTFAVYADSVESGAVSVAGDRTAPLGTFTGEFELRFSMSNIARGATIAWESWVLTFDANGQTAIIREDNWVGYNFGRTQGQFIQGGDNEQATGASATLVGFTTTDVGFYNELNDFTAPQFVITRSYADGVYTLTVVISEGGKSATLTLVEPATTGNTMTVSLGSIVATYDYSEVLVAEKGLTVSGITAAEVTVPKGTTLAEAMAMVKVTVSYAESTLTDTVAASACEYTCAAYNENVADTYEVVLKYNDKSTTVNVTVEAAAYSLIKSYSVVGEEFTDGTTAIGTTANGTFVDGGFKANTVDTVTAQNPFQNINATAITVQLEVNVTTATAWAPIIGFKNTELTNDIGAFMCLIVVNNDLQVSYNAWDGTTYADKSAAVLEAGAHTITLTLTAEGTCTVYLDGTAYTVSDADSTAVYAAAFQYLTGSCTTVRFFGGGFRDTTGAWSNLFDGYIQSCSFYNGLVPAEEISAL